jgi:hypothetical protein
VNVEKKSWLADLVSVSLQSYDPAAALLRLPPDLRGADPEGPSLEARGRAVLVRSLRRKLEGGANFIDDPFLGPIAGHIALALDIALVHGTPFEAERRRAELAVFFAALAGAIDAAEVAQPARDGSSDADAVQRAFVRAGAVLKARGHPPGDPVDGLPLRVGVLCIERRHLARLAIAYYGDRLLDTELAHNLAAHSSSDTVLLLEAVAAMASISHPLDARRRRIALTQVTRLGLAREFTRDARAAVKTPRTLTELARACPVRLRAFLLEQLLLSELGSTQPSEQRAEAIQQFAAASRIPPEQVTALQADAAELYAAQHRWMEPSTLALTADGFGTEWDGMADQMMEKVAATVTDNLEAIVKEVRQTGELGQLLAKAAAGKTLSAEERAKVKRQLLDLAKAVPALAIFAAPGGMLLLPILAKVLPFNVLPSAWEDKGKKNVKRLPGKKAGGA